MASESPSLYQIEAQIRAALDAPLPGAHAHLSLAPHPRRGWRPGHIPPGANTAAGLILLYPLDDRPHILLTVRAGDLALHAGQVSFPGGRIEGDETIPRAALREAAEEVGVDPDQVRVLGVLSTLYIPVSDFALHPVIGTTDRRPAFAAQMGEVGRILEVPLTDLLGSSPRQGASWRQDGQFHVPYYELCGERVWGATAMILAELATVLRTRPTDPQAGSDVVR